MPGGTRGRKKGQTNTRPVVSKSSKADLEFPVGRIGRHLRKGCYYKRYSDATAVYLAAVLEYLVSEVLDLAGSACKTEGRKRIVPTNIFSGIQNDDGFVELFSNIIISEGGRSELLHKELEKTHYFTKLAKRRRREESKSQSQSQAGRSKSKSKSKGRGRPRNSKSKSKN